MVPPLFQSPDLSIIEEKLKSRVYRTFGEFLTDVFTICLNCKTYNVNDPTYLGFANMFEQNLREFIDFFFVKKKK